MNKTVGSKKKIIDPPSGWKYGFPKEIPENVTTLEDFKEWFIKNGYPEKDIELALKYSRVWEE
jgi:hypothetical protein